MAECGLLNLDDCAGEWLSSAVGDAIENMARAVLEAFGRAVASLGTVWVNIKTPNLTNVGGATAVDAGSAAAGAGGITQVLGYVVWISLAIAVIALFMLGAMIATRMRAGEGVASVGRIGLVLTTVVLVSGASSLVAALLPDGPQRVSGTVDFLQSSLWWYMGAAAVLSVIVGAVRMAWEQRAEPGRELLRSLLTLVVVAGAGLTIINLLVVAADGFAVWILDNSLTCDLSVGGACFGESVVQLLQMPTEVGAGAGLGPLLVTILGLFAIFTSVMQILLMVARSGMLVILAGILPLSAAATNTEMGRTWFRKAIAWLVAFILYKPAAAIVYAAAFQLTGTDMVTDDGSGLMTVLTGLMLMILALFAMPALMRFVTPLVGATAGGAGSAALGAAALAALPTGAAALGRLASGSGRGTESGPGSVGNPGQTGDPGPSTTSPPGAPSTGGQHAPTPTPPSSNGATQTGASNVGTGAPAGTGATTTASTAGAGAGTGAAASTGAGAGAGAGAAAGPVGLAAGVALDVVSAGGQAAIGAARALGESSTGEGEGPSGSR